MLICTCTDEGREGCVVLYTYQIVGAPSNLMPGITKHPLAWRSTCGFAINALITLSLILDFPFPLNLDFQRKFIMSHIQLSLYTVITSIIVSSDAFTRRDSIIFLWVPKFMSRFQLNECLECLTCRIQEFPEVLRQWVNHTENILMRLSLEFSMAQSINLSLLGHCFLCNLLEYPIFTQRLV